jgi:flagellar hook assembly protein FlgD
MKVMNAVNRVGLCIALLFLTSPAFGVSAAAVRDTSAIQRVTIANTTINPTAHQTTGVDVFFAESGRATVRILDRDGYPVRTLAADKAIKAGKTEWLWDGRNDDGAVVPDEAYSLKVDWRSGSKHATYFPGNAPAVMQSIPIKYYDRRGGTLLYVLPQPSRVHVQSGSAVLDKHTNVAEGPVLKTIVNREPRAAGSIAEHWDGYDASGAIYVPDVPNFVISIAATPLPENSIITIGNKTASFFNRAVSKKARSLFTYTARSHTHHAGLSAAADVSPDLSIRAKSLTWSAHERAWIATGAAVTFSVFPTGPTAETFSREPGRLFNFVNYKLVGDRKPTSDSKIVIPIADLRCGANTISINWRSDYGAVAVNSLRVVVKRPDCRPTT